MLLAEVVRDEGVACFPVKCSGKISGCSVTGGQGEGCPELPLDPMPGHRSISPCWAEPGGSYGEYGTMSDTQDDLLGNAYVGEMPVGGPGTSGESG